MKNDLRFQGTAATEAADAAAAAAAAAAKALRKFFELAYNLVKASSPCTSVMRSCRTTASNFCSVETPTWTSEWSQLGALIRAPV